MKFDDFTLSFLRVCCSAAIITAYLMRTEQLSQEGLSKSFVWSIAGLSSLLVGFIFFFWWFENLNVDEETDSYGIHFCFHLP